MEAVRYYIPTRGRVGRQLTLKSLPVGLHPLVTLVCPEDEVLAHRADWPDITVHGQPDSVQTIGAKREYIFKELAQDVSFAWQFDDDLSMKICVSNQFKDTKKYPTATLDWFQEILPRYMLHYQVLGLGTSYFAPKGGLRMNYHLGFAFGACWGARDSLKMNRMDVFEDIDFTLQFLVGGTSLAVCYDVTVDQKLPDAPGGVTGERTEDTIRRDLQRLVELYPGIVSEKPRRPGAHPAAVTKVLWAKAARQGRT